MSDLTREKIRAITGPIDEHYVVRILETGASEEDVADAFGWLTNDDAMAEARHHRPTGLAEEVYEILEGSGLEEADADRPAPGSEPG